MVHLGVLGERLRSRLWPIPALAAAAALVLGIGMSAVRPHGGAADDAFDAASARSILEVLAGSSLTVVALVLSLQVVALQLAASQYSPRLLRTYARDWVVQVSMAVLIATFVFSMVTLALFGAAAQPPVASVVVALLLALGCVAALVGVVAHIVTSLRIETSMAGLHEDAASVIDATYRAARQGADTADTVAFLVQGTPFAARRSGFVQSVAADQLAEWAEARDVLVRVDARPGDHVLTGQPLGAVIGQRAGEAVDELPAAVLIGMERTPDADPGFGLLQLTDIALRALSPGVNDPTTAKHALGHLTSLVLQIADLGAGTVRMTAADSGSDRVLQRLPGLAELVRGTGVPVARAGGHDPDVLLAVLRMVREAAHAGPEQARPGIEAVARYVGRTAERDLADPEDRQTVLAAVAAISAP